MARKISIYSIPAILHRFGKLLGMAPFDTMPASGNKLVCKSSSSQLKNYLIAIAVSTCMVCNFLKLEWIKLTNQQSSGRIILSIFSGWRILSAILTIFEFIRNEQEFVLAYKMLHESNVNMKKLGKSPLIVLHFSIAVVCIATAYTLVVSYQAIAWVSTSWKLMVYDTFSNGIQTFIHCYALTYYITYVFMLYEHFVAVSQFANNLKHISINTPLEYPLRITKAISEMYEYLYHGANCINTVFNVPLFSLIIFNFTEILLLLYMTFFEKGTMGTREKMRLISYVVQLLLLLLPTGLVENKVNSIGNKLSESDVCYGREKLSSAKNTILLQTLQYSVDFSACGFFPISVSALSGQLSVCISLLLFLFQMVNH